MRLIVLMTSEGSLLKHEVMDVARSLRCGLAHLELVYLVTALVPSDTACLASSPGSSKRTAVWISLEVIVERLL